MPTKKPKQDEMPSQVYDRHWVHAFRPPKAGSYPEGGDRNGKWMLFVKEPEMDAWWIKVRDAIHAGKLGSQAKIATMVEDRPSKVICIYTYDSDDLADVERILSAIRDLGNNDRIYYKEDSETIRGNYGGAGRVVSKYVAQAGSRKATLQQVTPPPPPPKLTGIEDFDDDELEELIERDLAKRHGSVAVIEKQPFMDELHPSYDPPHQWRSPEEARYLKSTAWETTRRRIKQRDDFTCRYCGFRTDFWMIVDHVDGDPNNHDDANLQLLCAWCNSVKHAGLSTSVQGHMHLYVKTKLSQVEVIQQTRRLRGLGWEDAKILKELGLKKRAEFKMDYDHLRETVGFLFNSEKPTSIGWLTVSRPDGSFLRDDENRKRSLLPPIQNKLT